MELGLAHGDHAAPNALSRKIGLVVGAIVLSLYVAFGYTVAVNTHNGLDPAGSPLFYDFSAFYQAASMADAGHAASAYDDKAMTAAERAAFPGTTRRLPWSYPPTFQLMLAPFAALPYVLAGVLWCVGLYGLYVLMVRRLSTNDQLWLALLFPGAAVNLLVGQNGLLTTTLIGGGTLLLKTRPWIGGALLGLMAYKPHFAVLIPFVLIAGRDWRAFAGAAASGLGLALLATAAFGVEPWIAFLHKAIEPAAIFNSSTSTWRNIPSVMIMARSLGLPAGVASVLHWTVAAIAAAGAIWAWRTTDDAKMRAAALGAATLIVSPYLRFYDLALLILPIAALTPGVLARRSLVEATVLAAAWVLPVVVLFASTEVQLAPLVILALFGLVLWRIASGDLRPVAAPAQLARP